VKIYSNDYYGGFIIVVILDGDFITSDNVIAS